MASSNSVNLSKIKKQFSQKNIKLGGKLNFHSDASNKVFQLCKTGNKNFLLLSFQNCPNDYVKYLRADKILNNLAVSTPKILEQHKSQRYVLMEYYPIDNSSKYYQKPEIKNIPSGIFQNNNVVQLRTFSKKEKVLDIENIEIINKEGGKLKIKDIGELDSLMNKEEYDKFAKESGN